MPETIIYNQFEYILGATVGPAGGTGATMFATISGLSGNTRYEFILLTYNALGSTVIGPIGITTMYGELRESINLFSWEFPYRAIESASSYVSGNTTNLFLSTEDWGNTKFWLYGDTMAPYQTDPFGGTGAYMWRSSSSGGGTVITTRDQTPQAPMVLEPNQKYILSFWMDLSRGITFLPAYGTPSPTVFYFGSASFIPLTQILPYQGTEGQPTQFAPGASGWVRYAWSFTPVSGSVHVRLLSGSAGAGTYREMYVYGPQLEKA